MPRYTAEKHLPTLAPHTTVTEDGAVMVRYNKSERLWEAINTVTDETVGFKNTRRAAQALAANYAARMRESASFMKGLT